MEILITFLLFIFISEEVANTRNSPLAFGDVVARKFRGNVPRLPKCLRRWSFIFYFYEVQI